jgi:hypothetical protein
MVQLFHEEICQRTSFDAYSYMKLRIKTYSFLLFRLDIYMKITVAVARIYLTVIDALYWLVLASVGCLIVVVVVCFVAFTPNPRGSQSLSVSSSAPLCKKARNDDDEGKIAFFPRGDFSYFNNY